MDLVEYVNRHLHHQPGVLDPALLIVGIAYALWYFVPFQKCKAEVIFVSGFLF